MTAFLQSDRIILRPLAEEDFELITSWMNDNEVTYFMFTGQSPVTTSQVKNILNEQVNSDKNKIFAIQDKNSKKMIGYAGLYEISTIARKAEFRILIGDKDFWGKGYGTEVTEIMTYYGFDRLNLHRIFLGYTSANKGAKGAYEKAGYKEEGVLRDDIYRNSSYYDTVRMGLLRDEYYESLYENHRQRFNLFA